MARKYHYEITLTSSNADLSYAVIFSAPGTALLKDLLYLIFFSISECDPGKILQKKDELPFHVLFIFTGKLEEGGTS